MTDISDELRKVADEWDVTPLYALADRIDREMVELPKDRDGVPIHVGDTVYLDDRHMAEVTRIDLMPTNTCVVCWTSDKKDVAYPPSAISHKQTDSFERIADELEAWCDRVDVDGDACEKPRDIVERIRKLAKREGVDDDND